MITSFPFIKKIPKCFNEKEEEGEKRGKEHYHELSDLPSQGAPTEGKVQYS
jgi:hypothetical protein